MARVRRMLAVAIACLLTACGSADEAPDADADVAAAEPCGPARIVVTAVPPDSFTAADRCALVGPAMRMLGSAEPETGLVPDDTAAADSALLMPITEMREDTVFAHRWHVSLGLRGRPYNAELLVDRNTGAVRISRMHK